MKACQGFYNDFTLFSAFPVLSNMYTDKDSNLISNTLLCFVMVFVWGISTTICQSSTIWYFIVQLVGNLHQIEIDACCTRNYDTSFYTDYLECHFVKTLVILVEDKQFTRSNHRYLLFGVCFYALLFTWL